MQTGIVSAHPNDYHKPHKASNKKQRVIMSFFSRLSFFEPITRKENNTVLEKISNFQKKKKASITLEILKEQVNYGLLYEQAPNQWRIATKNNNAEIPQGQYAFVRTSTGFIRAWPMNKTEASSHLALSGYANKIRYAGEVTFSNDGFGEFLSWNNQSGGYLPSANLSKQAGLSCRFFVSHRRVAPMKSDNLYSLNSRSSSDSTAYSETSIALPLASRHEYCHASSTINN